MVWSKQEGTPSRHGGEDSYPDDDVKLYDEKHKRCPSTIAIILDCGTDDSGHELQQQGRSQARQGVPLGDRSA